MFLVLRRAFLRAALTGDTDGPRRKRTTRDGGRDPTKMLARRARGNTTVLYMAGFYGRTPYARADGRNLCPEIGGRQRETGWYSTIERKREIDSGVDEHFREE